MADINMLKPVPELLYIIGAVIFYHCAKPLYLKPFHLNPSQELWLKRLEAGVREYNASAAMRTTALVQEIFSSGQITISG